MGHPEPHQEWSGLGPDHADQHGPDGFGRRGRPGRGHGGRGPGGHGGRGERGDRGEWAGRRGRPGPPPWVAGLFGLDPGGEQRRGPRVRRGDVRSAILDVLRAAGEPGADGSTERLNGYQVIQQIAVRSNEAWKPSPGSVYPTIQQLQDEGLVVADDERDRRTLALTAEGTTYVGAHADELAAVWAPFERQEKEREAGQHADLKPEIGQVMGAVWQIVTSGSAGQRAAAVDVLVDTRRKLYGILADGDEPQDELAPDDES